jgi:hypothetical protein
MNEYKMGRIPLIKKKLKTSIAKVNKLGTTKLSELDLCFMCNDLVEDLKFIQKEIDKL